MKNFKEESQRVLAMLQIAGVNDQSIESLVKMFSQSGVLKSIDKLNEKYDSNIRIGEYVIMSNNNKGFWSNDFGWSFDKLSATGYSEADLQHYLDADGVAKPSFFDEQSKDAVFVNYKDAVDFDADF